MNKKKINIYLQGTSEKIEMNNKTGPMSNKNRLVPIGRTADSILLLLLYTRGKRLYLPRGRRRLIGDLKKYTHSERHT